MSVLPGHENLQPREVIGIDEMGFALVRIGLELKRYKMFIGPGGALCAKPFAEEESKLPDQLEPSADDAELMRRRRSIDQL